MSGEEIDQHLQGLAHRTAGVRPRADFGERVMAAIHEEAEPASRSFVTNTWHLGWRLLPVAAMAACVALVLAMRSASLYEDALVGTYDESSVELGW